MIVLLLRLYWEFLLIGMFSMGGGMATVPFLFDLSQRTAWFSTADLTTMIAISEATPGPIGVNMATYVGYITAGLPGGIVAPLGLTTPAFIIILLVSKIMNTLWQNPKVQGLFYALRPASVGLIAAAAFSVCGAADRSASFARDASSNSAPISSFSVGLPLMAVSVPFKKISSSGPLHAAGAPPRKSRPRPPPTR